MTTNIYVRGKAREIVLKFPLPILAEAFRQELALNTNCYATNSYQATSAVYHIRGTSINHVSWPCSWEDARGESVFKLR